MILSFFRTIKYAFVDFWRNFWLSFITITMVIFALISVNFLLLMNVLSTNAIKLIEEKVDVSVFFKREVNANQIYEVETKLLSLVEVKDVELISKDHALEIFREAHADDSKILASLDELGHNPLGDTLVIKANSANDFPVIIEVLENPKYADLIQEKNFSEHREIINKIALISDRVKKVGWYASLIFSFIAMIIVFNAIRVAIYTHRDEIKIMKLVGASNWFIKLPFYIQSLFFSFISTLAVLLIFFPFLTYIQPYLNDFFGSNQVSLVDYFTEHFILIFGAQFLAASVLNVFASAFAVRKYLRV